VSRPSFAVLLAVSVVALMTLAGLVLALTSGGGRRGGWGAGIGLLEIQGVITDDGRALEQIRALHEDPAVRGLLVTINSPGGVVAPSQSIYDELRRLRDSGLPVIASIGSVGASGGYYIALAADSIFALPGSLTGSIGVVMEMPEASELMDRVGVRVEVVKSAEHKDVGSPFRPITPADREILEALVMDVFEQFVATVALARGLPEDSVRAVADGRVLSGRQALGRGLIDRLGNRREALAAAGRMAGLGEEPRIVRPPRERTTLLDLILGRVTASAVQRVAETVGHAGRMRLQYVLPW
jgi:protease IV